MSTLYKWNAMDKKNRRIKQHQKNLLIKLRYVLKPGQKLSTRELNKRMGYTPSYQTKLGERLFKLNELSFEEHHTKDRLIKRLWFWREE